MQIQSMFLERMPFRACRRFVERRKKVWQVKLGMKRWGSKLVKAISTGILTSLEVQLKDVLERGEEQESGMHAPLTNLVCERHFGHLDASQRRRPHSSLHHHSSVIMLKQTGKRLRGWFNSLDKEEQRRLMKKARIESKELRMKHQMRDRKGVTDSLTLKTKTKSYGKTIVEQVREPLREGELVAVACEDTWYPALIDEACEAGISQVKVNFTELGKQLGAFRWPTGKDRHTVARNSLIAAKLDYFPHAGGQYYKIPNAGVINKKYSKYK